MSNKKRKNTPGAFGSGYPHEKIDAMNRRLSQSQVILLALVEHFKITQEQLDEIVKNHVVSKLTEASAPKDNP